MDFLSKLDGSDRPPRQVQIDTLTWLQKSWTKYDTFVLDLGVGTGKSFVARAIQRTVGGHVITPSNQLIDQYLDTYPTVNYLKGMTHYECSNGISCYDKVKVLERRPCEGCPYYRNRGRAEDGRASFLNPMSFATLENKRPRVAIFDEAHLLSGILLDSAGYTFKLNALFG